MVRRVALLLFLVHVREVLVWVLLTGERLSSEVEIGLFKILVGAGIKGG